MTEFLTAVREIVESINLETAAIADKLQEVTEDRDRHRQARHELQSRINEVMAVLNSHYGPHSSNSRIRDILEGTES